MELTQCINYLLTTAQHTVSQNLSNRLGEYDITPSQYAVLRCLWDLNKANPKEIAEALGIETSTISGVLDRMQKKGLIVRTISEEDRRFILVEITEKGKALEKPIIKIVDDVNEEVLQFLSPEEREKLKNNLRRIALGE